MNTHTENEDHKLMTWQMILTGMRVTLDAHADGYRRLYHALYHALGIYGYELVVERDKTNTRIFSAKKKEGVGSGFANTHTENEDHKLMTWQMIVTGRRVTLDAHADGYRRLYKGLYHALRNNGYELVVERDKTNRIFSAKKKEE